MSADFATRFLVSFIFLAVILVSCSDTAQRQSEPEKKADAAPLKSEPAKKAATAQSQVELEEKADLTQSQREPEEKIEGKWVGKVKIDSGEELRIEFEISRRENGALAALLNSPDQGVMGVPVDEATFEKSDLRLKIKSIQGAYEGMLKEDGLTIEGQWFQRGKSVKLDLKRAQ